MANQYSQEGTKKPPPKKKPISPRKRVILPMKVCEHCGKEYRPRRNWQKYCSSKCQHDVSNIRNNTAAKMRELYQRRKGETENG